MCFSPTGALAFPERAGGEGGMGIVMCLLSGVVLSLGIQVFVYVVFVIMR